MNISRFSWSLPIIYHSEVTIEDRSNFMKNVTILYVLDNNKPEVEK